MSKTDHPRFYGTHQVGHAPRSWREMGKGKYIDYGTPRTRLLATPRAEREAIAEQMVAYLDADEPAKVVECTDSLADYSLDDLAPWERELLDAVAEGDPTVTVVPSLVWSSEVDGTHPLNESDAHLDVCADCCQAIAWRDHAPVEYVEESADDEPWLPVMSIDEAFKHFGDDGWHVTGPRPNQPLTWKQPAKAGYVRVYELARDCALTSHEVIAMLRAEGEYVANHMTWVAVPVARTVLTRRNA